jgi:tellurite resistance protein TerC
LINRIVHLTYKAARRLVVAVVGATVLLIGVIMLVTPGPAIVVIPVGLAILSIEFTWARLWLKRLRQSISSRNSKELARRAEDHQQRAAKWVAAATVENKKTGTGELNS